MPAPEIHNFSVLFTKFPDEEAARLYFEACRWSVDGQFCPHCNSRDITECKNHKPMPYRCKNCRKHFSVRTSTILEESRLPLLKWLMAIYMMTIKRESFSTAQLAVELGITQKSALFLAKRIHEAWQTRDGGNTLENKTSGAVVATTSLLPE